MKKLLHPINFNFKGAKARVTFHTVMSYVWLVAMVAVPFIPSFQGLSNLAALLIMEVSLYANFATEFGAVDASKASVQTEKDQTKS